MKKIRSLLTTVALLVSLSAMAQLANFHTSEKARMMPLQLGISNQQTTSLIFPYAIKSVDRGTAEVLVQKAKGVENVLQLKAGLDSFRPTNLTVITADGYLYSFQLHYAKEPSALNLAMADKPMGYEPIAVFTAQQDNQEKILGTAEYVSAKKRKLKKPRDSRHSISMSLAGVYISGNTVYYQLYFENNSNISYDVSQLRFYVRDKKKVKRTASQEIEKKPVLLHGNATVIHEQSAQVLVVALEKFTIPDKKELVFELLEAGGGRNLLLKLGNKQIIGAQPLK